MRMTWFDKAKGWFRYRTSRRPSPVSAGGRDSRSLSMESLEQRQMLTVTVAATPPVAIFGQQTQLTATIAGPASGTVQFADGGSSLDSSVPVERTAFSSTATTSYVQLPNLDMGSFTFATWVKRDVLNQQQYIVMTGAYNGWGLFFSSGGTNNNLWFTDCGVSGFASNREIVDNNWHFVAITVSGGTATMYIDGGNVGSGDAGTTDFDNGGYPYFLGAVPSGYEEGCPQGLTGAALRNVAF